MGVLLSLNLLGSLEGNAIHAQRHLLEMSPETLSTRLPFETESLGPLRWVQRTLRRFLLTIDQYGPDQQDHTNLFLLEYPSSPKNACRLPGF